MKWCNDIYFDKIWIWIDVSSINVSFVNIDANKVK